MSKTQIMAKITGLTKITDDIFSMWLKAGTIAKEAVPGQFVSLYCKNEDRLLPRPISICEINREEELLRLVFRVVGKGTEEFSTYHAGDEIKILGPLGNGFLLKKGRAVLIGGGIGIPPLLELAKELTGETVVVLGYRDDTLFLKEEFEKYATVVVSTEDGSFGTKGNVIDAIREQKMQADIIYSCGPLPMLRGVKQFGLEYEIEAYLSMEERMACGIGACLACTCQSTDVDNHSKVHNKRICKDGPVFLSTEIDL